MGAVSVHPSVTDAILSQVLFGEHIPFMSSAKLPMNLALRLCIRCKQALSARYSGDIIPFRNDLPWALGPLLENLRPGFGTPVLRLMENLRFSKADILRQCLSVLAKGDVEVEAKSSRWLKILTLTKVNLRIQPCRHSCCHLAGFSQGRRKKRATKY